MTTVNIHYAKTHLSQLLGLVINGEDIILAKAGVPIAKITPLTPSKTQRIPGSMKGKIKISNSFDDPLPEDILKDFGG